MAGLAGPESLDGLFTCLSTPIPAPLIDSSKAECAVEAGGGGGGD